MNVNKKEMKVMEWKSTHKQKGEKIGDFLNKELPINKKDEELISLFMYGNIAYVAIQNTNNNEVSAQVILTKQDRNQYKNFSYKAIHENELPQHFDCSKGVLNALTPTDNENANQWREQCKIQRMKRSTITKQLEHHSMVKFKNPIIINGELLDTFEVIKEGRKTHFKHNGTYYDIPKWKKREFEIIKLKEKTIQ